MVVASTSDNTRSASLLRNPYFYLFLAVIVPLLIVVTDVMKENMLRQRRFEESLVSLSSGAKTPGSHISKVRLRFISEKVDVEKVPDSQKPSGTTLDVYRGTVTRIYEATEPDNSASPTLLARFTIDVHDQTTLLDHFQPPGPDFKDDDALWIFYGPEDEAASTGCAIHVRRALPAKP